MQYDYIVEVCKENPYRDPKTGRFTFAPGGKNSPETVPEDDTDVIIEIDRKQPKKYNIKNLPTIRLPKDEWAMVVSELNTHLSKEQRALPVVSKTIGFYTYTFENFGFDNYRFVDRKLAKSIEEVQRGED